MRSDELSQRLGDLYGCSRLAMGVQLQRYTALTRRFTERFRESPQELFSSPGRIEIGGNHTDHNGGKVLTASITLDTIAAASVTKSDLITIDSEGFEREEISLSDLSKHPHEQGTAALVRGICRGFRDRGLAIGGVNVCISSNLGIGSGVSSSASFEMLLGVVLNRFFNNEQVSLLELAKIGQFAENEFWGKPSGLLDQMACGVGGMVGIDFSDPDEPAIQPVTVTDDTFPFMFLFVDTGGSHSDLTGHYAAIPHEMFRIAHGLGVRRLSETNRRAIIAALPALLRAHGDRAVLRALHFFAENERVAAQIQALTNGDFTRFLSLVTESGSSSWRLLQNCYEPEHPGRQPLSLALALTELYLTAGEIPGGYRVHGGGFAGKILVVLPRDNARDFAIFLTPVFGEGACIPVHIRQDGAVVI